MVDLAFIGLTVGLLLVSLSLAWQSRITVDTSFGFLVVPFILLGIGMGFTMSLMSTAAMNAVDRSKAGVAGTPGRSVAGLLSFYERAS